MTSDNVYQAPEAELVSDIDDTNKTAYYTVSRTKMVILSVFTLNLYTIYWFYKHWQQQKVNAGVDCLPALRAIFQIFFVFSLFIRIHSDAEYKSVKASWSAGLLATIFIVFQVTSNLLSTFVSNSDVELVTGVVEIGLALLALIPLFFVQKTANEINGDPNAEENNKMTWVNWIFIALGGVWWLLIFVGLFLPAV